MVLSCRSWPAFAALWCASLILLRYAYPIYFDGAGPMPSFFYWGHLPGMAEYNQHTWHYELRFLIPYCIASTILAFVCLFVAPKVGNRLTARHKFGVHSANSLVLLFAAAASDMVNVMWLKGGVFLGTESYSYMRLLIVSLPLAIISGLLAVATDKSLTKKHRHIAH